MVLVKIINGKFGIIEYLEIPKGILVILMTFFIFTCRKQVRKSYKKGGLAGAQVIQNLLIAKVSTCVRNT